MKKLLILLITFLSLSIQAQTNEYEVISYLEEGFKAPNTNYLGEAWLNQLIRSDEVYRNVSLFLLALTALPDCSTI
jgi:hypothetical protein